MWPQQIFVVLLSASLTLQYVAAVINSGQSQKVEEPIKTNSESTEAETTSSTAEKDSIAESSDTANRREAPLDTYGLPGNSYLPPSPININLPVPVYGVPDAPSNNVVYPAPPPDIPPPPKPLYGPPSISATYGVPHSKPSLNFLPQLSTNYGIPPVKYGPPSLPTNLFAPKPVYGPPKLQYGHPKPQYGPPSKPIKFHKYPPKNFNPRPPKPIYGTSVGFKDNFNSNKLHFNSFFNSNTLSTGAKFSNLYSGVSTLTHQYGAPVLPPPKKTVTIQYVSSNSGGHLSSQYGVPSASVAYGPPQPSPNPRPPHPGAPAPPTPPDIKYDGWQPIPGLVSKRPIDDVHHVTGEGAYNDLSPPPLQHNHLGDTYGAPPISLGISGATSGGYKQGISDSYGAPLNTVTGSGGIVASSGVEVHGKHIAQSAKSEAYSGDSIGLVPPSGVYGAPPSGQHGTQLYSNAHGFGGSLQFGSIQGHKPEFSSGSSYSSDSVAAHPPEPSSLYSLPNERVPVSFQNLVHGSATSGLHIEGASALPLTSYNVPLGAIDGSYSLPPSGSSVGLDYSQPPVTIDLTHGKSNAYDCSHNKQQSIPSQAYGVPTDSYTSSLSTNTHNVASHASYGVPQPQLLVPSSEYGVPDLHHSSSVNSETKVNAINEETHGKSYGKSVAASFGPNSELVESQSIDLNNIPLQGTQGSYTLQIQSADGSQNQVPHTQFLNEGLLQSILQAIEQPGRTPQSGAGIPIIQLQQSVEQGSYASNDTINYHQSQYLDNNPQTSQINEVLVDAPKTQPRDEKISDGDNEETLQMLDTSQIALFYKKADGRKDDVAIVQATDY
ncbi:uncharacterized protein LOC132708757 [Cylas formicarius]|uniref:uncharacterized protein LOC132708757 n=1 Tax=Cylas formicarius TaxID=197179 RepID=UPI0029585820|nr:uncharacterized protein LOC132708757 [Cylas formicarius]